MAVHFTAVGPMVSLALEPSIVTAAGLHVVTLHGEGFVQTAALTCRVGKAERLPAVFLSASSIQCSLPALKSGNITVTADGGIG